MFPDDCVRGANWFRGGVLPGKIAPYRRLEQSFRKGLRPAGWPAVVAAQNGPLLYGGVTLHSDL
jgi:hypothetical protein